LLALVVYDARWQILPNKIIYPTAVVAIAGRGLYIALVQEDKAEALLAWGMSIAIAAGVFFVLYELSRGAWIGFGDVRLGFITGSVLAGPLESFIMIFLASILGLIFSLPGITKSKKGLGSKIPFGPYLITATFLVFLFGNYLVDAYKEFLLI
jgi:prepilin signal peptidase PulO-like enzyme (type II secretory pathway)